MAEYQNIVGSVAGICTAISMLPQLVKMIVHKKATDIALPTLIILAIGLILWVYYGVLKNDWPIIVTNSVSLTLSLMILGFRSYYKSKGKSENPKV